MKWDREKIISTSIELFNDNRATNVSTVHIANALGISPGNLYYYFNDKAHIIRVIWNEEITPKLNEMFYDTEFGRSESGILRFFVRMATYAYRYRFFYLEINSIFANDPELKDTFVRRAEKIMKYLESIVDSWISLGIMKPIEEIEKGWLIENCWTMGQLWLTRAEILYPDKPIEEVAIDEVWHVYAMLKPHFTDVSNERIQQLMKTIQIEM